MKTIEVESTVGNFLVRCKAEVTDNQFAYFASKGLLWAMQRQSEVDKVLGAFTTDISLAHFTAKGKGPWRKKDWTRNSVDYSADKAGKLQAVFANLAMPDDLPALATTAEVLEYIRDVAESKYRDEKAIMSKHESKGDLEEWLAERIGYTAETHGEDGEFSVKALGAIRAYIKAELAKLSE
jgi:hypothetical protein